MIVKVTAGKVKLETLQTNKAKNMSPHKWLSWINSIGKDVKTHIGITNILFFKKDTKNYT